MNKVTESILSATLKAEAIRIRYLRHKAKGVFTTARNIVGDSQDAEKVRDVAFRLLGASECPSQRARCANLAIGFVRGTPYKQIERTTKAPTWSLYGSLAREVSSKAGASHDDVVNWMKLTP